MNVSAHRQPFVHRLMLQDFRSYQHASLDFEKRLIALTGENGAGKTNVLEALSLFTPGRGLRRIELGDMVRHGAEAGFSLSLSLESTDGDSRKLGTGYEPAGSETPGRRCRIDGVWPLPVPLPIMCGSSG